MRDRFLQREGVAHDVNGIMARAMLIAEQLSAHSDAAVASRAVRIERAIEQASEICRRELTDDPDGDEIVMDAADVDHLLNQIVQLVGVEADLAQRPIDFFISTGPDVELFVDRTKLFRIIFNLTLNAANAIAARGGSWIEISVTRAWRRIYVDICDDGPGLPQHILDFLYPGLGHERAAPSGRLGSGLVTAAALASSAGGELKLVKSTSEGAQFCLTLPEGDAAQFGRYQQPKASDHPYSTIILAAE
ncbi:MAG: HAMP domain-containing sensor histidine kinase [Pseudomonadota bacterium]